MNILFFDLSLFHMQPGIIAGDEVKYNHKYIMSHFQHIFPPYKPQCLTNLVMLSSVMILLTVVCLFVVTLTGTCI